MRWRPIVGNGILILVANIIDGQQASVMTNMSLILVAGVQASCTTAFVNGTGIALTGVPGTTRQTFDIAGVVLASIGCVASGLADCTGIIVTNFVSTVAGTGCDTTGIVPARFGAVASPIRNGTAAVVQASVLAHAAILAPMFILLVVFVVIAAGRTRG